jgi:hypothetical protein
MLATTPVGEVSKIGFDLLFVSYVLKRYNCHFVLISSARVGYGAPVRHSPGPDPARL